MGSCFFTDFRSDDMNFASAPPPPGGSALRVPVRRALQTVQQAPASEWRVAQVVCVAQPKLPRTMASTGSRNSSVETAAISNRRDLVSQNKLIAQNKVMFGESRWPATGEKSEPGASPTPPFYRAMSCE